MKATEKIEHSLDKHWLLEFAVRTRTGLCAGVPDSSGDVTFNFLWSCCRAWLAKRLDAGRFCDVN
jgi:hypothetical protein